MVLRRPAFWIIILVGLVAAAACQPELPPALDLSSRDAAGPEPTPLPSPPPQQVLTICLGEEPRSLFFYGDLSRSASIIRQAIYDDPVDLVNSTSNPVLLREIPSQENGLVAVNPVTVLPGQKLVDARGNITFLANGVQYRPAGCSSQDCWEVYRDQASIELDQVEIQFRIKEEMRWSDGNPLLPEDSLFSHQVASLVYGTAGPPQLRYTSDYQVGDEGQLIWRGLPGYLGLFSYSEYFFLPLPSHQIGNFTREEFLTAPQTTQRPLGWGPYQVVEWVQGDHITLVPNPNYYPAEQGVPVYDAARRAYRNFPRGHAGHRLDRGGLHVLCVGQAAIG